MISVIAAPDAVPIAAGAGSRYLEVRVVSDPMMERA
jgi:hypothetical protein